ncbi:MAG: hypothetical protein WBC69_03570 [Geitlerinemataceae cyanobacterium]
MEILAAIGLSRLIRNLAATILRVLECDRNDRTLPGRSVKIEVRLTRC